MVGRCRGSGCEQSRPSLSTNSRSSSSHLPTIILGSLASAIRPAFQCSRTRSTSRGESALSLNSNGLRPHATSKRNAPNA
ncbi:hypothetical protein PR202_ga13998 [Eleusine coracana subsp. coracana]|uniref:Uncharacterized protein n=1 Tax=Eleusine coracana subsp. coracana TaxID=191504 RepID=A0AAV5CGB4_ELECO|nr:hypothetical protein PR202_ga13998 [Eleusine coracana subsp. coracana]